MVNGQDLDQLPARAPLATQAAVAAEPAPFPLTNADAPDESFYDDWRHRLTANLARRSDGRWDPLTRTHAFERTSPTT